jgi:hypothetical protein
MTGILIKVVVLKMPHGISKKALEKFLTAVPWDKVVKKAENAEQGTRLWPTNKMNLSWAGFA